MRKRHLFITGLPAVGKTTAVLRIIESLARPCAGFYSQNIFNGTIKNGIRLLSLNGQTMDIQRLRNEKGSYSDYIFDTAAFDRFFLAAFDLRGTEPLILIDELGPLICRSENLLIKINEWLEQHQVLGTLARRGHAFIESVHRRSDTDVVTLTAQNRDDLVAYGIAHFS